MGHRKGPVVKCPKCGKSGRAAIMSIPMGETRYYYLTVFHLDGTRCIIMNVDKLFKILEEVRGQP